jgi:hypothetical protein
MFDSPILDVGIGMVLVYFVLGLIASGATDIIRQIFNFRARTLRRGLEALLDTSTLELFHKVRTRIQGAGSKDDARQDYIPSRSLALALIAEVEEQAGSAVGPDSQFEHLAAKLETLARQADNRNFSALAVAVRSAGKETGKAVKAVQDWFDDAFQTMAAWRKRRSQWIVVIVSAVVAVVLNADTVLISRSLWQDTGLRAKLVALAEKSEELDSLYKLSSLAPDSSTADTTQEEAVVLTGEGKRVVRQFLDLPVPLGWSQRNLPTTFYGWLLKIVGLLATALAVSLGAPFWYDILRKLLGMRKTLKRKEEESTG